MHELELFKKSLESYVMNILPDTVVSLNLLITYRDEQTLAVKAYRKATIESSWLLNDGKGATKVQPFVSISENYNHSQMSEDEEKNNILSYLAELDENGVSAFDKELNNPQRLYEAAWFLRYGKEAFDTLINAYESEIAKYKKDKPVKAVSRGHKEIKSIYDLH